MPKIFKDRSKIIRYIYLYLVTAISIVMIIIASVGLIRLVLEEYVFDLKGYEEFDAFYECGETGVYGVREPVVVKAGDEEKELTPEEFEECKKEAMERRAARHQNDVKRRLIDAIAMLLVAVPVYMYHWGLIRREGKAKK